MVEINVSLEDLIRSELGEGKRVGRRYFWLCPFHQERHPSLTITPDGQHWKCFGCGKSGDAIQWVRDRRGISFREAVRVLQGSWTDCAFPKSGSPRSLPAPKLLTPPSAHWMHKAAAVVADCIARLNSPTGNKARQWLQDRGLTSITMTRWQIGYNPSDRWAQGLYIHHGITIPWFLEGSFRAIKIRRPAPPPKKYAWVKGSRRAGLFLSQEIRAGVPTLIVEGEFDALLGWQEIRDLVNVGTLGSVDDPLDQTALEQLLCSPLILLNYDNDKPGQDGPGKWHRLSARVRDVRLPQGKDLTEFFLLGGDVRSWIVDELRRHHLDATRHLTVEVNPVSGSDITVGLPTRHLPDTSDSLCPAPESSDRKEAVTC